jgi:hypothetical protein
MLGVKEDYIRHVLEAYVLDEGFDAVFGDEWIDSAHLREIIDGVPRYALAEYNIDSMGMYTEISDDLFSKLISGNSISQQGDEYSDYWYRLRPSVKVKYLTPVHEGNPATQRIGILGEEALRRALVKIVAEDGLRSLEAQWAEPEALPVERNSNEGLNEAVPASDRIVLRSDNEAVAEEAADALTELSDELRSDSNEVGDAFGDDRLIAATEVEQLAQMVNQPRIRVQPVLAFAQRTLTWIAEKAGAATVAELAKRAWALLFAWLNT